MILSASRCRIDSLFPRFKRLLSGESRLAGKGLAKARKDENRPLTTGRQLLTFRLSMKRRRPKSLLAIVAAAGVPSEGAI